MAGSGQRATGQSNGGMRIDDHAFFGGSAPAGQVFPNQAKMKKVNSAEGAGEVMKYEDTNDRIVESQKDAVKKVKSHQGRLPEYRN